MNSISLDELRAFKGTIVYRCVVDNGAGALIACLFNSCYGGEQFYNDVIAERSYNDRFVLFRLGQYSYYAYYYGDNYAYKLLPGQYKRLLGAI